MALRVGIERGIAAHSHEPRVATYTAQMRAWGNGVLGTMLVSACALLGACGSSEGAASPGAAASAGAAGTQAPGGIGGLSASGGTPGEVGGDRSGSQNGGSDSGGAQNIWVAQIVVGQGGGPPRCFPRSLPLGLPGSATDGQANCFIAEFEMGPCDCSQPARAALTSARLAAVKQALRFTGCGDGSGGDSGCDSYCGCEIVQTSGTASDPSSPLHACQNELMPPASVNGFCAIDQMRTDASGAASPLGNPAIVAECPASEKRLIRFVGAAIPARDSSVFLGCMDGIP